MWRILVGVLIAQSCVSVCSAQEVTRVKTNVSAAELRARSIRLETDLKTLAVDIGERNLPNYDAYMSARDFIKQSLSPLPIEEQKYEVKGQSVYNIYTFVGGSNAPGEEIFVVGAHYDSVEGSPGADDNGSGVVALLEAARHFSANPPAQRLMLVFFGNEEPPYFQKETMGSLVFAKWLKSQGVKVRGMISLETMGYFTDEPNSQKYPFPLNLFYPDIGNFIGVVSNQGSRTLGRSLFEHIKSLNLIPTEFGAVPGYIPGVGWSDHWSFWKEGYLGVMLTDTAPYRNPYYHTAEDTVDKLDFAKLSASTTAMISYLGTLE